MNNSEDQVRAWMQALAAGQDIGGTKYYLVEAPGYVWTVWDLAQAANSHFDFTSGDAEPEIVNLAREVLGPDAPQGAPDA